MPHVCTAALLAFATLYCEEKFFIFYWKARLLSVFFYHKKWHRCEIAYLINVTSCLVRGPSWKLQRFVHSGLRHFVYLYSAFTSSLHCSVHTVVPLTRIMFCKSGSLSPAYATLQSYNSPAARELFKPSTDSASLLV